MMTSPFLDKSLSDLRDMALRGELSDPELDALAACVCDGEWLEFRRGRSTWGIYRLNSIPSGHMKGDWLEFNNAPRYTTDPREAMRLLVKYRINIFHYKTCDAGRVGGNGIRGFEFTGDPCRAITLAAIVAALTEMMEEE